MLTREQLAVLNPILSDAVVLRGDTYHLRLLADVEVPIVNSAGPLKSFNDGWRPGLVLTLFHPVLLLEFLHEGGHAGFWLLNPEGVFIGNDFTALPPFLFELVGLRGGPAVNWLAAMGTPGLACMQPASVSALLALHLDVRREIVRTLCAKAGQPMLPDAMLEIAADDPLVLSPAQARIAPPDDLVITAADMPTHLGAGWRVDRVSTLFAPVVILELLHEDGHQGVWYVDRRVELLGNTAQQLRGAMRTHLESVCTVVFEELRERLIMAPALPLSETASSFLQLQRLTRDDLLSLYFLSSGLNETVAHRWPADEPPPAPMSYSASTPTGQVLLDPNHTRATCQHFLRTELFRQAGDGAMMWPSPVDGHMIRVVPRTFYIDDFSFAYQMCDDRTGLTFYIFAQEGFFRGFAAYFPSADLVVGADRLQMDISIRYTHKAGQTLLRHVTLYGADLATSLLQPPAEIVHAFRGYPAIHLGHFVWQDLSGVSYLVDAFPPEKLPRFYVFDTAHHPEIYGPIDEIFPELAGKVVRIEGSFVSHIEQFYRDRQSVIKSTGISVPGQVGRRIIAALRRSERWHEPVLQAAQANARGAVVVVGLRIGNRTIEDMEGFTIDLVAMLARELGRVTIVIDGHNSAGDQPGSTYASFGDTLTGGSTFMQREMAIADSLEQRYRGTDVTIVSNIDRPVQESVIWCSEADFFVAPWGAALAKYRWVCNTPGLATVGRWNLENRHDLAIYHHPAAMDHPTPMYFNAIEAVTDVAEPGSEGVDRSNYTLDETLVFAQVRDLIAAHVTPRLHPAVEEPTEHEAA
ncbi:hypothetical protein [Lichenicola sp.]|uniref:hypothetical protein n=1 Tax=Lichenicola sp. TaxID=2804529 RepID=UPI003B004578